jgi:hypothetical protein
MAMLQIKGTGVRFYGYTDRAPDGSIVATKWVSLFYFPLLPLSRLRIRPTRYARVGAFDMPFEILAEERPRPREVLATYAWCWIVLPVVLGGPFAAFAAAGARGLLPPARGLFHAGLTEYVFLAVCLYAGVLAFALRRWDRGRAFPPPSNEGSGH